MTSLDLIPNDELIEKEMLRQLEIAEAEEENSKPDHIEALKRIFGHENFRPKQWKIIDSVMNRKKDVCATMITGHGKSLCYQFPSAYNGGITIIVSPLISLMERQVVAMKTANVPACLLGRANSRTGETITRIENSRYRLVYLTPEFCTGNLGPELFKKWYRMLSITLIAIDESHCLSSWGQDFRVSYRKLGILREIMPTVPILAISATANKEVMKDVISVLKLRDPQVLSSSLDRPNLSFAVFYKSRNIMADLNKVMIRHQNRWKFPGPTIIYCLTRKRVGYMSYSLLGMGLKCLPYHAGLSLAVRREVHEKFVKDEVDVVVATVGFGMGIEKLNVRTVIHYGISKDIDRYYQEINRAGRDGLPAKCVLFYDCADFCFQDESEEDHQVMLSVKNYVDTRNCRRRFILNYFNETDVSLVERPDCCDNCLRNISTNRGNGIYQGAGNNSRYALTSDSTMPLKPSETYQDKRFLTNKRPPSSTSPTLEMKTKANDLISKTQKTSQMQVDGVKVNLNKSFTKEEPGKLYNALLEKRLNLASIEKCIPNKIVSDEALTEMAEQRPSTLEEMANCHFYEFTAERLAKYGMALLDVIKEKTVETSVETVHEEKAIEKILTLHPLVEDSALGAFAKHSYSLLISGKSVEEIAEFRGLLVRTVQDHLSDCIKFGLPVKLAQVGIPKDDVQKIIQAAIDTGLIVKNIKSACSGNITNGQVKLVVAYLQVREHLRMVGTPYKEFEDSDYLQFYKSIETPTGRTLNIEEDINIEELPPDRKLSQFIRDLEECSETYIGDDAEVYPSRPVPIETSLEDITVSNLEESNEKYSSERTKVHSGKDNRNRQLFKSVETPTGRTPNKEEDINIEELPPDRKLSQFIRDLEECNETYIGDEAEVYPSRPVPVETSLEDITVNNLEESNEKDSSERTKVHSCRDNRNSAGFSDGGLSDGELSAICDILETSICSPFYANQSFLEIDSSDDEPSLKRVKAET